MWLHQFSWSNIRLHFPHLLDVQKSDLQCKNQNSNKNLPTSPKLQRVLSRIFVEMVQWWCAWIYIILCKFIQVSPQWFSKIQGKIRNIAFLMPRDCIQSLVIHWDYGCMYSAEVTFGPILHTGSIQKSNLPYKKQNKKLPESHQNCIGFSQG